MWLLFREGWPIIASMKVLGIVFLLFIFWPPSVGAQELTPRAYWPAPHGTRLLSVGLSQVNGDIAPDPTLPITEVDSDIQTAVMAYLQTISLFGRTANVILDVPYSHGDTMGEGSEGDDRKVDYRGLGDITATLAVNFKGAPSLSREEFAELRRDPQPILGGSIKLVAPTGSYNSDRLINVGANRWAMKAELGTILPLKPKWLLEFEAGVWIFADNDNVRGLTREQDAIYALNVHLVHRFRAGFWAALDASAYRGGRSRLGGQRLDDLQRDTKAGFTVLYPFLNKNAVKFKYSKGSLNDSNEDFDTFLIAYQRLL
jgi:hypothetical protein